MPHTTKNDDAGRYMIGIKEMQKLSPTIENQRQGLDRYIISKE